MSDRNVLWSWAAAAGLVCAGWLSLLLLLRQSNKDLDKQTLQFCQDQLEEAKKELESLRKQLEAKATAKTLKAVAAKTNEIKELCKQIDGIIGKAADAEREKRGQALAAITSAAAVTGVVSNVEKVIEAQKVF